MAERSLFSPPATSLTIKLGGVDLLGDCGLQ